MTANVQPVRFPMPNSQIGALPRALIKVHPEDWQVTEIYDEAFQEEGEHAYLYIEKRCLSTIPVAQWLSEQLQIPLLDVGYAGMKDKHALTRQWFSLRQPGLAAPLDAQTLMLNQGEEQIKVLASHLHHRKLRRGEHQGNRFRVVLRELDATIDCQALANNVKAGFPNYFGPQRFGRHNLADALTWLGQRRRRKVSRQVRGWHLSVLRSWIFNRLLADRVADGTWQEILEGDVLAPGGDTIDGVPVGPLWGRGREILSGQALSRQEQTLAATVASEGGPADGKRDPAPEGQDTMSLGEVCEALEYAGVDRGQRPLSVVPWDVHCESADETVTLSFSLPVGAYATVMLSNHFDLQDKSVEHRV